MTWSLLIEPISRIIDKIIPDKEAAAKAKIELIKVENQQALQELQISMSAILAEANSTDPWTSRARPSFLYVIYILILSSIPMAIVYAYSPQTASDLTKGFHEWLSAIPEPYLQLFGVGYLGYTTGRTWEKVRGK
jgi:hypothetical protein